MSRKKQTVRLGSYARLSRDDGEDGVSNSIVNQQQIMRQYCERHAGLAIVREYADDGFSGTTFDRPAWRELEADLEGGVIDGFIVKDSSRFCRNFVAGGMMLERVFPKMNGGRGVRVIMVNDSYDSASSDPYASSLMMAFKGLFNDNVSRDTSVKTRAGLHAKMQRGECACAYVPYGYVKDPKRRSRLAIDPDAAPNVRLMFRMKLDGKSTAAIAEHLNRVGAPCPTEHKRSQGMSYAQPFAGDRAPRWHANTVGRILANEVYAGTLVQGRTYAPSFRSRKTLRRPPEEWFCAEGAHPAIVSRHEFDVVQDLMSRDTRTAPGSDTVALFGGVAFCADCGQQMQLRGGRNGNRYLVCSSHKRDSKACSSHMVNEAVVADVVQCAAGRLIEASVDTAAFVESNRAKVEADRTAEVDRRIGDARKRQERALHFRHGLVDDLEAGVISEDEYAMFADSYAAQVEEAREVVARLEAEREHAAAAVGEAEAALARLAATGEVGELNRRMVVELVDRVTVHADKSIDVRFRVEDVMERAGLMIGAAAVSGEAM